MDEDSEHKQSSDADEVAQEVSDPAQEYSTQADYLAHVAETADSRSRDVAVALREAFKAVIRLENIEVIDFRSVSAMELAQALESHPIILKPLLAVSNVAGRALERDLDLKNIDTYGVRLTSVQAHTIAGYLKPFLPGSLPIAALTQIDRVSFIDKEIRAHKGRWERTVTQALTRFSGVTFKKAKFLHGNQQFELDAAYIDEGRVRYGVDVKRIEARRDIHKRADEIVNKAAKLKEIEPNAKFGAVIYYPFTAEQGNIRDRLESLSIDSIQFAGQTQRSVNLAVRLLLSKFGVTSEEDAR